MTTVTVDIKQESLATFFIVCGLELERYSKESVENVFKEYSFTLYKNRMHGDYWVTVQIPIERYILYLGYGLVK